MNHALALATEWGENFRQPIDARMLLKYPDLTDDEIARIKKLADDAEWTQAFLEATNGDLPWLDGADVEPLAARALRGMRTKRANSDSPGDRSDSQRSLSPSNDRSGNGAIHQVYCKGDGSSGKACRECRGHFILQRSSRSVNYQYPCDVWNARRAPLIQDRINT